MAGVSRSAIVGAVLALGPGAPLLAQDTAARDQAIPALIEMLRYIRAQFPASKVVQISRSTVLPPYRDSADVLHPDEVLDELVRGSGLPVGPSPREAPRICIPDPTPNDPPRPACTYRDAAAIVVAPIPELVDGRAVVRIVIWQNPVRPGTGFIGRTLLFTAVPEGGGWRVLSPQLTGPIT